MRCLRLVAVVVAMSVVGCASVPEADATVMRDAEAGDREAQYELGMHYYRARYAFGGKSADWEEAARWFEPAAEAGDPRASFRMAQYAFNVRGDYAASFAGLGLPAQAGIAEAQHLLGVHYAQGWGTPQDLVLAYKWLALAVEGGVPDPHGSLADLDWLVDRGQMTAEHVAAGRRLAAEHTASYGRSRSIDAEP